LFSGHWGLRQLTPVPLNVRMSNDMIGRNHSP